MNGDADDLLPAAGAIADGAVVNWDELQASANLEQSSIIEELKALQRVASVASDAPSGWGSFVVIREIGRGAFGGVYEAVDPNLQIAIALKIIRSPGAIPIGLTQSLKEARLLAKISHPNVVRVYRADQIGDEVGIAMELVRGETLEVLVRRQTCSANEALLIGLDLCRALAAVHGAGLLHGDIKARNVMREHSGRIVLMDFGAGRDLGLPVHDRTDFAGTPVYLAPEVFKGQSRSVRSDIYSVGVLLYYLVTGGYPIEGSTTTEIRQRHERRTSRRLRDVRPDLPDAFIRGVDGALAEDPEARYQSAGAMEAALVEALSLSARPRRESTKKNRKVAQWAGIAIAATVIGLPAAYRILRPPDAGTPSSTAVVAPDLYRIEAGLYVQRDGRDIRLGSGMRVSPGDKLSLQIQTSVPAYVYVVDEDEQGESYLLYPLPGGNQANPLAAGQRHVLPGPQNGQQMSWQVTSAGGREHFLIFASPERAAAFEQLCAALPTPKRPCAASGYARPSSKTPPPSNALFDLASCCVGNR
jgi:serine/threonine protein kinase